MALHVGITKHDELVSGDEVLRQMIGKWKKYLRQAEEKPLSDDTKRRNDEPPDRGSSVYQEVGEAFSVQAEAAETGQAAERAN